MKGYDNYTRRNENKYEKMLNLFQVNSSLVGVVGRAACTTSTGTPVTHYADWVP
jgi:hypothetical protein